MDDRIAIRTDLFEHREVKPTFINPCCFGEDFAGWLKQKLAPLKESGFLFSASIQEDYGWGFWVSHGKDRFWVALSYVGNGAQEEPAEWIITVARAGFLSRLLRRSESEHHRTELRNRIWELVRSDSAIQVVELPQYT